MYDILTSHAVGVGKCEDDCEEVVGRAELEVEADRGCVSRQQHVPTHDSVAILGCALNTHNISKYFSSVNNEPFSSIDTWNYAYNQFSSYMWYKPTRTIHTTLFDLHLPARALACLASKFSRSEPLPLKGWTLGSGHGGEDGQ